MLRRAFVLRIGIVQKRLILPRDYTECVAEIRPAPEEIARIVGGKGKHGVDPRKLKAIVRIALAQPAEQGKIISLFFGGAEAFFHQMLHIATAAMGMGDAHRADARAAQHICADMIFQRKCRNAAAQNAVLIRKTMPMRRGRIAVDLGQKILKKGMVIFRRALRGFAAGKYIV